MLLPMRMLGFPLPNRQIRSLLGLAGLVILAWMLAVLPLIWALLAVAGMGGGLLLVRWPWLIWPGLAVALPVAAGVKLGPLSALDVGVALGGGLWLADGVRRRSLKLPASLPLTLTLIFVATQLLALPGAADLGEAVKEVVKWVEFGLILLLVPPMLGQTRRVTDPARARMLGVLGWSRAKWLVMALLAGAMAQAVLGLYQFVFRIGPDFFVLMGRFMRAYGSFSQPNPFAGYLGLTLPVAVSLALLGRQKAKGKGQKAKGNPTLALPRLGRGQIRLTGRSSTAILPLPQSGGGWEGVIPVDRLIYLLAAGVIGAGILASWSRGGWLGAAAGVGVVMVVRSRRAALLSAGAGLLLIIAIFLGALSPGLVPAPIADRVADIPAYFGAVDVANTPVTDANFAVLERLAHWDAALKMWADSPWLGVGPGNYAVVYDQFRLPQWDQALGHAHNIYLNTLAESGLIGLAGFMLLWGGLALWLWGKVRRSPHPWTQALAVGMLGVLAYLAVHSFFDNLFVQGIYLHIALGLATVMSTGMATAESDGSKDERDGFSQN